MAQPFHSIFFCKFFLLVVPYFLINFAQLLQDQMNNQYNIKRDHNPNPPKKEQKKKGPFSTSPEAAGPIVDKIIAIVSGKGGAGKSTVAVNLAITLARMGYKWASPDADVYGPSVPKMTGTEGEVPGVELYDARGNLFEDYGQYTEECTEIILPIEKFGVKWMSIGYFARPEQALIWRGSMACNALKQMILQVKWGELDFLLIDLPPGTGDIHISLVHDIPLDGAIIVSTPQAVALTDVEKGVNLFRNENVNKHIYGIIENMSWFTPAELPQNKYYIFGKDGCKAMSEKYNLPLLGQVPLVQSIREGGDEGNPAALLDGPLFDAMKAAALQLLK